MPVINKKKRIEGYYCPQFSNEYFSILMEDLLKPRRVGERILNDNLQLEEDKRLPK